MARNRTPRQIRLDPEVEAAIQNIADAEVRSFSSCCNWLLKLAAERYFAEKGITQST